MEFSYIIEKLPQQIAKVSLKGDILDKESCNNLMMEVDHHLMDGHNKLIINLKELNYMNSAGLSSLISLLTKARNVGGEAVIYGLNNRIKQLIVLTKLNTIFSVMETEDEAIKTINE